MKCFRFNASRTHRLTLPFWCFLVGAGLCSAVLAGNGATLTVPSSGDPAETQAHHVHMTLRNPPPTSYAVIRQRNTTIFVGASQEIRQAHRYRKSAAGDYLWIRQGEQQYVLDDPALMTALLEHWQPLQASEQKMAALEQQLKPYTDELENNADAIEEMTDGWAELDTAEMAELQTKMEALQDKIEPISDQMEDVSQEIDAAAEQAHQHTLSLIAEAVQSGKARLQASR